MKPKEPREPEFLPSQVSSKSSPPLPYTASPVKLLCSDIFLCLRSLRYLPGTFLPLTPWRSGTLDELYPSRANLKALFIHAVLVFYQLAFILLIPTWFVVPGWWVLIHVSTIFVINRPLCKILNGDKKFLVSHRPSNLSLEHESEHWMLINGVAVGEHWLQSNIDRLSLTFRRKIVGAHNPTSGLIFDVIQCLIERSFCYPTDDVRQAYPVVKDALLSPKYKKVVLILHSQGAIEGGLIIDWLLDEISQDFLQKLEVYTFGSAANHFNNPDRDVPEAQENLSRKQSQLHHNNCIRHIEHYANSDDFVSVWGVLSFIRMPNRYMGRLFLRHGSGHQLNQHYLDNMFPIGRDGEVEDNDFMDSDIQVMQSEPGHGQRQKSLRTSLEYAYGRPVNGHRLKVKDLSRLWQYRNGLSPAT